MNMSVALYGKILLCAVGAVFMITAIAGHVYEAKLTVGGFVKTTKIGMFGDEIDSINDSFESIGCPEFRSKWQALQAFSIIGMIALVCAAILHSAAIFVPKLRLGLFKGIRYAVDILACLSLIIPMTLVYVYFHKECRDRYNLYNGWGGREYSYIYGTVLLTIAGGLAIVNPFLNICVADSEEEPAVGEEQVAAAEEPAVAEEQVPEKSAPDSV